MICSITYPASCKETASALAKFPAPTIAMRGFFLPDMPGSIAEAAARPRGCHISFRRKPDATSRILCRVLYCSHVQVFALQVNVD